MIHASGTPPTRVLTVNNPQLAASNMAMQKASVKELPRKEKSHLLYNIKHFFLEQERKIRKYLSIQIPVQEDMSSN